MADTKKITISIPDGLFKRLEPVKETFNVSAVCQEAIRQEVNRQELISKENGKMDTVIKRLKMEKKDYDTKYKDIGFNDGYEDAKKMHYKELVEFAQFNVSELRGSGDGKFVAIKFRDDWCLPFEGLHSTRVENNKFLHQVKSKFNTRIRNQSDPYINEKDYKQGWCNGVKAFWTKVQAKLQPQQSKKSKKKQQK